MAAVTGRSTYVPGKGTTVRSKSGKAKTYEGSGPAPSGTKKVRPKTAATAPTITEHNGEVTFQNVPARQRSRALVRQSRARRRVRAILRSSQPDKRPTANIGLSGLTDAQRHRVEEEGVKKEITQLKADLKAPAPAPPAKVNVAKQIASQIGGSPAELKKITAAAEQSRRDFIAEGNKPPAPAAPSAPQLKGTPQRRKAVRRKLQAARARVKAQGSDGSTQGKVAVVLRNHGFTKAGTAGVLGNAKQESSYITTANDGAGNGGLFGFTASPVSLPDLQAYAASKGQDWTNPKVQTRFMLEHLDSGTKAAVNSASSPREAAVAFQEGFEKPGEPMQGNREAYAEEAFLNNNFSRTDPKAKAAFLAARKEAKALGMKVAPLNAKVGPPPKQVVTRFKAGMLAAKELAHAHIPYVWGGGHAGFENSPSGLDCSGAVSWVLHKMGVLKSPVTSAGMGQYLAPGPGAVTVFYNAEHTFMAFGNKFFGTSVNDSSKGLAFYGKPDSSYLSRYSVGHVKGLGRKQAIQLGLVVPGGGGSSGASGSFTGVTLSEGGTTATINTGAGVVQKKAGWSSRPIKLTKRQQINRAERKLAAINGAPEQQAEPAHHTELERLEHRYGKAAV